MHGHFRTLAKDLLQKEDKRTAGIRKRLYESHDVGSPNRGIPTHDRDGIVRDRDRCRRLEKYRWPHARSPACERRPVLGNGRGEPPDLRRDDWTAQLCRIAWDECMAGDTPGGCARNQQEEKGAHARASKAAAP